jgi:hypothetical protein
MSQELLIGVVSFIFVIIEVRNAIKNKVKILKLGDDFEEKLTSNSVALKETYDKRLLTLEREVMILVSNNIKNLKRRYEISNDPKEKADIIEELKQYELIDEE